MIRLKSADKQRFKDQRQFLKETI